MGCPTFWLLTVSFIPIFHVSPGPDLFYSHLHVSPGPLLVSPNTLSAKPTQIVTGFTSITNWKHKENLH